MKLLYFAWMKAAIGHGEETVELPAGITTVGQLVEWLAGRGDGYAKAFRNIKVVRAAINQQFVSLDAPLAGATEIAFFPPVTGG